MEQKGIPTERGNINRQVAENNKLLKVTRARISRLMKWQREDKIKPLDLTKTGEKISVMAQLQGFIPQTQASQYQKIKNLKDYTSIISFLERNEIDDIDDFHSKIVDINKSFYVLKGEITQIDKEIYSFDKKIELWEEYEKLKPTLKKYNALSDSDKKIAYKKHFAKIDRAKELKKIWKDYIASGNEITPNVWKRESAKLKNNKKLYNWKMEQLREELGRAEKITKRLDEMQLDDDRVKSKTKEVEI